MKKVKLRTNTIPLSYPEVMDRFLEDFGAYTYGVSSLENKIPTLSEEFLEKLSDQLMQICDEIDEHLQNENE